jgi:hypothetical protein
MRTDPGRFSDALTRGVGIVLYSGSRTTAQSRYRLVQCFWRAPRAWVDPLYNHSSSDPFQARRYLCHCAPVDEYHDRAPSPAFSSAAPMPTPITDGSFISSSSYFSFPTRMRSVSLRLKSRDGRQLSASFKPVRPFLRHGRHSAVKLRYNCNHSLRAVPCDPRPVESHRSNKDKSL